MDKLDKCFTFVPRMCSHVYCLYAFVLVRLNRTREYFFPYRLFRRFDNKCKYNYKSIPLKLFSLFELFVVVFFFSLGKSSTKNILKIDNLLVFGC